MDDSRILDVLNGKVKFEGDFFSIVYNRLQKKGGGCAKIKSSLENTSYSFNKKQRKMIRDLLKEAKAEGEDLGNFEELNKELEFLIASIQKKRQDRSKFEEVKEKV